MSRLCYGLAGMYIDDSETYLPQFKVVYCWMPICKGHVVCLQYTTRAYLQVLYMDIRLSDQFTQH